jgi:ATP-dependent DNA ligase
MFDERNESWDGTRREFHQLQARHGTGYWGIAVVGNAVQTWFGKLGGTIQTRTERFQGVNLGKKNEMSPEAYALDRAKEMCRKKHWEGYREFANGVPVDALIEAAIDFDNLPLNLCFYKPDNSMGAKIEKKAQEGKVWYARKANGMMFAIAKGTGDAKLYSRRMLRHQDDETGDPTKSWDRRFYNIVGAANLMMPQNSILLGELVVRDQHGNEDFKAIQSLTKSLTEEAFAKLAQYANEMKYPAFYCWDIAFWDGQDLVKGSPVRSRFELIHEICEGQHILPVEFFDGTLMNTPAHAIEMAKKAGWEGFVVVDPDGIYGDKGYNFKGKPDRPGAFCAKLKPSYEDDFIAIWDPENGHGERSTKDRSGQGIKSVALYQYNSKGELVSISNVSSGLTDAMKRDLADPKFWPRVWKVEYTERTYISQGDDTNALTFARFIDERADKKAEECINSEL